MHLPAALAHTHDDPEQPMVYSVAWEVWDVRSVLCGFEVGGADVGQHRGAALDGVCEALA